MAYNLKQLFSSVKNVYETVLGYLSIVVYLIVSLPAIPFIFSGVLNIFSEQPIQSPKWIKWPRGKHNGQRIDGFLISLKIHFLWWHWKPVYSFNSGEPYFIWLFFSIRAMANYDHKRQIK